MNYNDIINELDIMQHLVNSCVVDDEYTEILNIRINRIRNTFIIKENNISFKSN